MAITESSGNGYALYNGVKLPSLPEWDKETYPHAIIVDHRDYGSVVALMCFPANSVKYGTFYTGSASSPTERTLVYFAASDGVSLPYARFTLTDGAWSEISYGSVTAPQSGTNYSYAYYVPWTNTDIPNLDTGGIYMSATDPISLDGMTVIEWDGDTTDLTVYEYTEESTGAVLLYYRVADAPSQAQMSGGYTVGTEDGSIVGTVQNSSTDNSYWKLVDGGLYLLNTDGLYTSVISYLVTASNVTPFKLGLILSALVRGVKREPVAYLYNGVRLPKLPSWDKTEFPYAFIEYYGTPVYATLFVTDKPLGIWDYGDGIGEGMGPEGGTSATWKYMKCRLVQADNAVTTPAFGSVIETSNPSWVTASDVLWANYDVPNYVDGGTLLSASDPIPVYE